MSGWTLKLGTGTGYTSNAGQWWYQFTDDQGYNYYPTDPALSPDASSRSPTAATPPGKPSALRGARAARALGEAGAGAGTGSASLARSRSSCQRVASC
jgi:hypothetical protein